MHSLVPEQNLKRSDLMLPQVRAHVWGEMEVWEGSAAVGGWKPGRLPRAALDWSRLMKCGGALAVRLTMGRTHGRRHEVTGPVSRSTHERYSLSPSKAGSTKMQGTS